MEKRPTVYWVLVLFFGSSVTFGTLRTLTEDESAGTQLAVQVGALALIVAGVVLFMKLRDRGEG